MQGPTPWGVGVPRAWTYTLPLEANQQCASQQARTKKSQRDPSNKRSKAVLCESSSNVGDVESVLEYQECGGFSIRTTCLLDTDEGAAREKIGKRMHGLIVAAKGAIS